MKASPIKISKKCWGCGNPVETFFSLKDFPFTGRFPKRDETSMVGDLTFNVCQKCKLIQLEQAYSPNDLYSEYYYRSSINNTMRVHLSNLVISILNNFGEKKPGKWLDIGCNDGFTLSLPKAMGWETTGVDPSNVIGLYYKEIFADNIVSKTEFINDIFPPKDDTLKNKKFEVITCISMFYDIFNLQEFVKNIDKHLSNNGIWVIEMNYTKDMIQENGYDMISHEHITYFTVTNFIFILNKLNPNLRVFNCIHTSINGGSITLYVDRGKRKVNDSINEFIDTEEKFQLNSLEKIKSYFDQIKDHANKVKKFISEQKKAGKTISIYGASTRGNTNLLLSELNKDMIDFAYEKNSDKFERFCPGSDILIKNEKELLDDQPDYLIIMPYSFISEFIKKEHTYLERGGKMITLVPEIKIYTKESL